MQILEVYFQYVECGGSFDNDRFVEIKEKLLVEKFCLFVMQVEVFKFGKVIEQEGKEFIFSSYVFFF